jgi:hypothetical protein
MKEPKLILPEPKKTLREQILDVPAKIVSMPDVQPVYYNDPEIEDVAGNKFKRQIGPDWGCRELTFQVVSVPVTARCRKLRGFRAVRKWKGKKFVYRIPWTLEPPRDLKPMHGFDVEEEIVKVLTAEICSYDQSVQE